MSVREKLVRAYRGQTQVDFIGRRRTWFSISAGVLAICIGSFIWNGLNLGIEFAGGIQMSAPVPEDGPLGDASDTEVVNEVTDAVVAAGAADAQVQVATDGGGGRTAIVQTKETSAGTEEIEAALEETVGAQVEDLTQIGEKWGGEITEKAIRGLIIFVVVVAIFLALWFEWKMSLAAMIALVHDLTITAGIYSLVGFEVTPASVIAILTILGYSLYDTVVVFDRVEEDTTKFAATGRMTYQDAANQAMNEVFMRSLNTSLATILPVGALLFIGAGLLGASTLKDLALALLVGLIIGAYSSIFVATPFLAMLKEREPKFRNVRAKVLRDTQRAAGATQVADVAVDQASLQEEPAQPATVGAKSSPRPASTEPSRPRAGTKKAKRRKRR
ncbi:MAG TPA: protein translocase subunit SecF [Actinomycetota bacterium]|nr:protein translocase subunit SecF [Actinomycetota bacterium]